MRGLKKMENVTRFDYVNKKRAILLFRLCTINLRSFHLAAQSPRYQAVHIRFVGKVALLLNHKM